MKSFDAFGKPVKEFQVTTACGGYLSLCSVCLILILFLTELRYFLLPETRDEMLIDHNQVHKSLNLSLSVVVPEVPCSLLGVNLLDPKRLNAVHVQHEILKTRLSKAGYRLGTIRDSLDDLALNSAELATVLGLQFQETVKPQHSTPQKRCPSCFRAGADDDDCCRSCGEVLKAFKEQHQNKLPTSYTFAQCAEEVYRKAPAEIDEGCQVEVTLNVKKVPATLHLGVSRHANTEHLHPDAPKDFAQYLDWSHVILSMSFGPNFPGLIRVLDGRKKSAHTPKTSEHHQYDLHVIPTRYADYGATEVVSHQYSVTEYSKPVQTGAGYQDSTATGLWLSYDFTPFEVKVTRSRKSLWHFLTECCAILGGIFAFTGMLDNFAYQINKALAAGSGRSSGARGQLVTMEGPT